MPQLEIHHSDGNVTYAELTRDKPLMVGSGSNCDIVLADSDVKRVHCRILWRSDRSEWRVEVAADAGGVQLGGKFVKAGTIRSGDVIGISNCRIYIDDAQPAQPSSVSDLMSAQQFDSPPASLEETENEPVYLGRSTIRKASSMRDTRGFWQKFMEAFGRKAKEQFQGEEDRPPGQERILGSPLIRWMVVAFVVISAAGAYFYYDYTQREIVAQFEGAQKEANAGNFELAIRRFEEFYEQNPYHKLASNAKVQRALCEVQSNVTSSPAAALFDAQKMIRDQIKEPGFAPLKEKIVETVGKVAQNLAESARDKADRKFLEQALEAVEIVNRDFQGTKLAADVETKLNDTIKQAEGSILKFEELIGTMETMDAAMAAGTTKDAYAAYERLIQLYGEFKEKSEIVDRLSKAWKMDQDSVQWEAMNKSADTQPRAGAVAAATVLLDRKVFGDELKTTGNVQFVLAGGAVSAHDGNNGKMLWSMVVGRDTNVLPIPLTLSGAAEPSVLVIDMVHDELVAVQTKTGKLVWRQSVGEPIGAAPLPFRNKLYQPTSKGSLFVIDQNTGRIDGRLKFGGTPRFATSPAVHEASQHLFLLGEQYLLYNITLGGVPKCETLPYYTAHRSDSVFAAPLRLNRYLVLFENQTSSSMRIRVFLLSQDGKTIDEIQQLPKQGDPPINGWVHFAPAVYGNHMFVATDLESVHVYSGGAPEKADGFTLVKSAGGGTPLPGTRPQAHTMFYTDKDLLVQGSRARHYAFAAEQQALNPAREFLVGAASQPIQRFPTTGGRVDFLYLARHMPGSSAVALTALDATNLEPRWEVLLGAGLLSLQPADAGQNNWSALTRSGHLYSFPSATLTAGGVLDKPVGRIDVDIELSDSADPVVMPDGSTIFTPVGTPNRLYVRGAALDAAVRPLDLLAPLQAPVVSYEDGLLAAATDGRIYFMSPVTGKPLAEPFQPPLVAAQPAKWRGVVLTTKKTIVAVDDLGNVYQIELLKQPSPNLAERASKKFPKPIRSGVATSGDIIASVDESNVLQVWDAEVLSPIGEIRLPSPASLGPVSAGGFVFVVAGDDELICVNPQGQEAWRHLLKGQHIVGRPLVKGDSVHFATSAGLVHTLRLADGGEAATIDTEKPLTGGPIAISGTLVVIGDDGSLNVVKAAGAAN
jgi:outer membrane protein assembly factor BamB